VKKLVDPVVSFAKTHPYISCWIVLAIGMVIMLLASSTHAGLLPRQLAFLALMTVLLAGACVWIISWDADEDDAAEEPV
jgi:4-hydroxybenzoate polyprenyltransferase